MSSSVSIESIGYKPFPKANAFWMIGWLPRLNVRREYGNERELRETRDNLATPIGWDGQYPAIAEVANEEEVAEVLKLRQKQYDDLKAALNEKELPSVQIPEDGKNVTIDGRTYLLAKIAVFEFYYMDPKTSKLRKPTMLGTTGNRRGSCIVDAGAVQLILARRESGDDKLQPADAMGKVTDHIAIIVPDTANQRFPDVAVRKQAQIRENETKEAGFKRMTDAERLEAVLDLVENHGKSQSDIRNSGYGAVLGLRLYFACVVDIYCRQQAAAATGATRKLWEGIKFLNRLMQPQFLSDADRTAGKVNPNWLDFGRFQQKSFQGDKDAPAMGLMTEVSSKFDKENKRRKSLKTPMSDLERPTPEAVQKWINDNAFGDGNRQKPSLKRQEVQALSERHANPFVQAAMTAVDKNDTSYLNPAVARAAVAKFVWGATDEVYQQLELATTRLRELDDETQVTLLQAFVEQVEEAMATAGVNLPDASPGAGEGEGEGGGEATSDASAPAETHVE